VTTVEFKRARRPSLVVAITYPIHPPLGGGQVRAYNLYRGLAKQFDVEFVTLGPAGSAKLRLELAPGLSERRVPKSPRHAELEVALEREAGTVVTDIAMAELYEHTPAYMRALADAVKGADGVVACHPYTFPALRQVTALPLWYEAQDVEASLKRHVLGSSATARRLLAGVERVERDCCRDADLIWACSTEDAQELIDRYDVPAERLLVVPNGAALNEASYASPSARRAHRRRLRMDGGFLATFVASWHEPNVAGGRRLLEVATEVPEVDFLILGSVGTPLAAGAVPDNVAFTGTVSLGFKQTVLSVADAALNPVTTGSGTNLKMLDYFAAGIPVISTAFGARGLGVRPLEHYLPAEPYELAAALRAYRASDPQGHDTIVQAARTFVETRMSWDVIADDLLRAIAAHRGVDVSA
jgi:glycosyltransferase involved in cell wall biosynthesis